MHRCSHRIPALPVAALIAGVLLVFCPMVQAQGTRAEYARADNLRALTQNRVFKARVQPHWFAGNKCFWYRNDLSGGRKEFILVDASAGRRMPAFDHVRLAAALAKATGKAARPDRLPIERLEFDATGSSVVLYAETKPWQCDLRTYALREWSGTVPPQPSLPAGDKPHPSLYSGSGTSVTFVNRTAGDVELFWIDPEGRPRRYGTVRAGDQSVQHTYAGHVWLVADPNGRTLGVFEATEEPGTALITDRPPAAHGRPAERRLGRQEETTSPDGKWTVFVKENNLWLRHRETGELAALTQDGTSGDAYTSECTWSPDSQKLAAVKRKAGEDHKVFMVESSPQDQVQPKLHTISYLKPGDRIPIGKPHLFDIVSRQEIPVDDALFPNPWSITELRWQPDSQRFTFLYNQRGHQILRLIAVDVRTGRAETIIDERSKTFIDYAGKSYIDYLDQTGEIIWMSERDGWNHLYLYDARTGRVKNQITHGEWVVRGVDRVDVDKRRIWFRAGGIDPGQDPYYVQSCAINFDGSGLVRLTRGDGTHTVTPSPDGRFLIDTYSRVDMPPVTELRRAADGKLLCPLEKADASALSATGWRAPERFVAKGRDGKTDIYGIIVRPTKFDVKKRYPVIENIYAGPQSSFVPKAFSPYYGMQALAELGFIVVQIDGMGTSNRSRPFHDVCWRNLGDAGFPDRILWMKAVARKYPYADLSRVGIYGTSAGGQNALRGLLAYPEFYKVGVADSGCHDNRMDKIWWNELWMGWPVGPEYAAQSNVTNASKLRGKLLLMLGELDTNVDPASTMQVVNALINANKDFSLLLMPGAGHGVASTPYGRRRLQDFFVRYLLGVPPPDRNRERRAGATLEKSRAPRASAGVSEMSPRSRNHARTRRISSPKETTA